MSLKTNSEENQSEKNQEVRKDIFERMMAGEPLRQNDPEYPDVMAVVAQTLRLNVQLNNSASVDETRKVLSEVIGKEIDSSTIIFAPFHTNFGRFIKIGKNVFINHACSFLDMGGITIEDHVQIGPKVNLITENHPLDPTDRKTLIPSAIVIKQNAWIGAAATVLPGVTIGQNAVVAAGAVVTADVLPDTVVAGVPARVIKHL